MAIRRDPTNAALSKRVQVAFGRRLRAGRKNARQGRVHQQALAVALSISRTSVSNLERGRHRVFLDQVYAAANALGLGIEELLPPPNEVFPSSPVITSRHASVAARSVRTVTELVRVIQQRAASDDLSHRELRIADTSTERG